MKPPSSLPALLPIQGQLLKILSREERQEAISILAATAKGTGGYQLDFTTFGYLVWEHIYCWWNNLNLVKLLKMGDTTFTWRKFARCDINDIHLLPNYSEVYPAWWKCWVLYLGLPEVVISHRNSGFCWSSGWWILPRTKGCIVYCWMPRNSGESHNP